MTYEFMIYGIWMRIMHALPNINLFGRPRRNDRDVLEEILWLLKTGARWRDMSKHLPAPVTCRRRLRNREKEEIRDDVWRAFITTLNKNRLLDWKECLILNSWVK